MSEHSKTALVPAELLSITAKHADDKVFEGMSRGAFLPRIQLNAANTKIVIRGKAKPNTYALVKGKDDIVQDFGDKFNCLVLCWRPKAARFEGDNAKMFYNPKSAGFQSVEKDADKKPRVMGAMYGPEFLVYLPSCNEIATLHCNNPTMRNRAAELRSLIGQAATLTVQIIEKNNYIWPGPVILPCSTSLGLPEAGSEEHQELTARLRTQIEKFCNPPEEEEVEEVAEEAAPSGERTR